MRKSALNSSDIPVDNARYRDVILARVAQYLTSTKRIIWYLETLVLSARFMQLLNSSQWGSNSKLFVNRHQLWNEKLLPKVNSDAIVFEFGVAAGAVTKWWSNKELPIAVWHGFDTFTGLPTPWSRGGVDVMAAGVFDQSGTASKFPIVKSKHPVKWHKGLISETLVNANFPIPSNCQIIVFIDVDLYQPTKEVLSYFARHLKSGDLIYFDEGFDPWNEGLALRETMNALPPFTAIAHTGSALLIEIGRRDA